MELLWDEKSQNLVMCSQASGSPGLRVPAQSPLGLSAVGNSTPQQLCLLLGQGLGQVQTTAALGRDRTWDLAPGEGGSKDLEAVLGAQGLGPLNPGLWEFLG